MMIDTAIYADGTPTDEEIAQGVRFDNPQSQFAPDGMISPILGRNVVNNLTTQELNLQNYRLGKFMRMFSETGFDGLQEVEQTNGDTVWTMVAAIDNQDFSFYVSKSGVLGSVVLDEVQSEQQIDDMAAKYNIEPEKTYIIIDGVKYFVSMNVPLYFGTGQNNDAWINMGVFVLGDGVVAASIAAVIAGLGYDAFKDVMKNIGSSLFETLWSVFLGVLKAVGRFITTFMRSLFLGESLEVAVVAAGAAAGEAWSSSVEGVTSTKLKYSVVGVIVIVSIMLIIEFVLHESYQNVYFYNLTDHDITLEFPYKDFGDYYHLPTSTVLAETHQTGPGGIDLGSWYNGVGFRYQSDSEFHGLGYTIRLKMVDPKTKQVVKTFSCLFDVPYSGENSLYASIGEPSSYSEYYDQYAGVHKTTQYSTNDGTYEIIVTYDYLSGQHPDPETGTELYLYSSLIIIRSVA
jgi:hypothetical protein